MHRDIKPENIIVNIDSDIPRIKLIDFGLSKLCGPDEVQDMPCGTLFYLAPEVLEKKPYHNLVDVWSIGVMTYAMIRGQLPFEDDDEC